MGKPTIRLIVPAIITALAATACGTAADVTTSTTATSSTTTAAAAITTTTTTPPASSTTIAPTSPTVSKSSSTTTSSTTTVPKATSTTTTTTTTAPGGPYVVGTPSLFPPPALAGSGGAGGSGCAPGTTALPDGVWFGYVGSVSAGGFTFDLACFFFGEAAYDAGADDGEEVYNDYYVRNQNPMIRTITLPGFTPVYHILADADLAFAELAYVDWPPSGFNYIHCPSDWCGLWLYINGGSVTEIMEQYIP